MENNIEKIRAEVEVLLKMSSGNLIDNPILDQPCLPNYHWGYKQGLKEAAKRIEKILSHNDQGDSR